MCARKLLFTSKIALIFVLGYAVLKVVLLGGSAGDTLSPNSALGDGNIETTRQFGQSRFMVEDYRQIAKRNPFGSSGKPRDWGELKLSADTMQFDSTVSHELGIALIGTVAGSPAVARAIIKDLQSGTLDLYRPGQVVGGARIEAIETETVILIHDGERKILRQTTWKYKGNNKNIGNARYSLGADMSEPWYNPFAKRPAGTNSPTRPGVFERVLSEAIIEPYKVNGQTEGLKITGLEDLGLAGPFALKNGDIIRNVNGQRLTSKQKAFQILKKARTQDVMNVEFTRNDREKRFSFGLN